MTEAQGRPSGSRNLDPESRMSPEIRDPEWEAGAQGRRNLEPRNPAAREPRGTPLDPRWRIPQDASLGFGGGVPLGARPPSPVRSEGASGFPPSRAAGLGWGSGSPCSLPRGCSFRGCGWRLSSCQDPTRGPRGRGYPHPTASLMAFSGPQGHPVSLKPSILLHPALVRPWSLFSFLNYTPRLEFGSE